MKYEKIHRKAEYILKKLKYLKNNRPEGVERFESDETLQMAIFYVGFDVDDAKIDNLNPNNEENIGFTTDPSKIKQADFILICVPTPVTKSNLRSRICDM